jgi:hypothetical protein
MFFWKKKAAEEAEEALDEVAEAVEEQAETKASMKDGEAQERRAGGDSGDNADDIKLFPGFEDKPFKVGYTQWQDEDRGPEKGAPVLVMRWASDEKWFPVPTAFNKAFMQVLTELEQDGSLTGLLKAYGYDVEGAERD